MSKIVSIWGLLVCVFLVGCESVNDIPNGYIQTTEDGSSTLVLKGYESSSSGFSVFQPEGFEKPFYIAEKKFCGLAYRFVKSDSYGLSDLASLPEASEWQETVDIMAGSAYWARYVSAEVFKYVKFRVAYIDGNNVGIEYVIDRTEERPNTNANKVGEKTSVATLEVPHLNAENTYVDHHVTFTDGSQVLNMAIEWNAAKKHAQWVAFAFDNITAWDKNIGRTDAWGIDLELPESMRTDNSYHTSDGFDRGHLCASEDRQYSKEANEQTFLYSNMTPQLNAFNGGFWMKLEARVQSWGYSVSSRTYTNVYVAKGGTLNELAANLVGADNISTTAEGYTIKGLACPKYYYMAVLAEKDGIYQAIAFLVPHDGTLPKNPTAKELQQYVVSIDNLEEKTQVDFFCNLPDDVENEVESYYDVNSWMW